MKMLKQTPPLRMQLTLFYSLLVAFVLILFGLLLYVTLYTELIKATDQTLTVRTQQVSATLFPSTGDSLTAADLSRSSLDLSPLKALEAPGLFVRVFDAHGRLLKTSDNLKNGFLPIDYRNIDSALQGHQVIADVSAGSGQRLRLRSTPIVFNKRVAGVLQVGESLGPLDDTMTRVKYLLLALGGLSLAVAAGAGWFVSYRGLKPLRRIAQVASAIRTSGDFSQRLGMKEEHDEIGTLASAFDDLLGKVEETLVRHREFVADCSHELRTPLLVVRGNLDLIGRLDDEAEREECLREARAEAGRMQRMVADLLLLVQVERGQVVEFQPVELRDLLAEVYRQILPHGDGHALSLAAYESVAVLGDRERLKQVVVNLVENALHYTPEGGSIMVGLDRWAGQARIRVRDNGIGIAAEEQEHIFDRFYRVDRSRGRNGAGAGLGLSIVRYLTEAHGGQVTVDSTLGRGSTFTVLLPLLADEGQQPPDEAESIPA